VYCLLSLGLWNEPGSGSQQWYVALLMPSPLAELSVPTNSTERRLQLTSYRVAAETAGQRGQIPVVHKSGVNVVLTFPFR
jgi:hypothetical protein